MKQLLKIFPALVVAVLISCTDDAKLDFSVEKPESLAQYEYLNAYDVLKSYVDRTGNPGFKLGAGILASEYNPKGFRYSMVNLNFDDITAGNAMKYASVVKDDGSMDFSTVIQFIETARDAGISVYGHTLAWHSQQNNTYLNGLIEPQIVPGEEEEIEYIGNRDFEMGNIDGWYGWGGDNIDPALSAPGEGRDGGYALKLQNNGNYQYWEVQCAYSGFEHTTYLAEGKPCKLSFWLRGEGTGVIQPEVQSKEDLSYESDGLGTITPTSEWKYYELTTTVTGDTRDNCLFSYGEFTGTLYLDDVSLTQMVAGTGGTTWVELLTGGDFEKDDFDISFQLNGNARMEYTAGSDGTGRSVAVNTPSVYEEDYESQFIFVFSPTMQQGETYKFSMDIKADRQTTFTTQTQSTPGAYLHWTTFGEITADTEWETFTYTLNVTSDFVGGGAVAFNFGKTAGTVYIDNISFTKEAESGSVIEKTDEEKKEILTGALDTWIAGMMKACDGYVKAWDVVNEPMSDWPDPTQLKSDPYHTDPDNFYWQDYLGKDYARTAIKLAREYGGDDLILFVNEYGLEGIGNEKCRGLINMIGYWEEDRETRIDGIASQMHVTLSLDPVKQQSAEEAVVTMYQLLAATGKLIKVSELDMGIEDEDGNTIKTSAVTFEQQVRMADFYQFIIEKYFEIIPVNQQYGITQWSLTHSPEDSGWRAGEPVGLWDHNYRRTPAYGGFADGLNKNR